MNGTGAPNEAGGEESAARRYQVLARKYRPLTFAHMVGQEALVRTLTNAIDSGRLAHAFLFTGVRGVGKTTAARILARALNCTGDAAADGGPTANPCGVCENCRAIAEDRHVDVIEMDAASRTGVDDIREIIEGVRYRPVMGRYKIYIIDEVHMLSRNAFNALLKTLEEPPAHVKFIFATTEARRLPVTVLSRCQRFDLRRIDSDALKAYLARLATAEGVVLQADALSLLVRGADGSARDGISLLDQAISHAGADGAVAVDDSARRTVSAATVRRMMGLADRHRIVDLFERLMAGDAAAVLDQFAALYADSADPEQVLQDLLDLTHWLTRRKVVGPAADADAVSEDEAVRGAALAERLTMGELGRAWQILFKGLEEVQAAPMGARATEMVLLRLVYAVDLPTPDRLTSSDDAGRSGSGSPDRGGEAAAERVAPAVAGAAGPSPQALPAERARGPAMRASDGVGFEDRGFEGQAADRRDGSASDRAMPQTFEALVALVADKREPVLRSHLLHDVRLVSFAPGDVSLHLLDGAPRDLPGRLVRKLDLWTGRKWTVQAVASDEAAPTITAQKEARAAEDRESALEDSLVRATLDAFPGARVKTVRPDRGERTPDAAG